METVPVTFDLYQPDPGFPISLARAEMQNCEMSMTGQSVNIKFDAVTLMGGKCVDTNNDGIPDIVDYTTQVQYDCKFP